LNDNADKKNCNFLGEKMIAANENKTQKKGIKKKFFFDPT
jgi:hypothetical protein